MGNSQSSEWSVTYLSIKNKHDHVFRIIEQAISLEEQEKPLKAIEMYKEGIKLIDDALSIPVQCPENPDSTWDKACSMIKKIKKTRAEVLVRINCIQSSPGFQSVNDQPPSYEEAVSGSNSETASSSEEPGGIESQHVTYRDLAAVLHNLSMDPNQCLKEELVYSYPGVRLYFISPTGDVLATREPQLLKISLIEGSEPNVPKAILQIGDWIYPLVPGVSPCYRTDYGAFILPDLYSDISGSSVGIILPSDADSDVFDLLESILHGIVTQETEREIHEAKGRRNEREDASKRISDKIVNGAWVLSQGIVRGAQKAGEALNRGTPKLIESIEPNQRPIEVSASVQRSVKVVEAATSKAVQVTGYVAERVGEGTALLGKFLAPHVQKQGTKLLRSGFHMSEQEASEKMKSALTIAAGAVEGFSTVYRGLETSAGILGTSLKDNTVKVVEHKWGPHCASTTESSLNAAGNVYNTYENTKIFKPKRLIKGTAKGAGKAVLLENSEVRKGHVELINRLEAGPSRISPPQLNGDDEVQVREENSSDKVPDKSSEEDASNDNVKTKKAL
ncbi:protein spartin isoform X2 [Euwallacea similis]